MDMSEIFETIEYVKKIMGGQTQDEAEKKLDRIAENYRKLHQTINQRLRRCQKYIGDGKRTFAFGEAEKSPLLFDVCEALLEIDRKGWQHLCEENNWVAPDALNTDALTQLKKAYAMDAHISPFLVELRRASNTGNIPECVKILRQIVEVDHHNPEWKSDLEAFEAVYLEEIYDEYNSLKKAQNHSEIPRLYNELEKPWRIHIKKEHQQRFTEIYNEIESYHQQQVLKDKQKEAKDLFQKIITAYHTNDLDQMSLMIPKFRKLETAGVYQPDQDARQIYESALQWYEKEQKKIEKEQFCQEKLQQLEQTIQGKNDEAIKPLLTQLHEQECSIPEETESMALGRIEAAAHRKETLHQRKRIQRSLLLLSIVFIFLIAAVFFHYYRIRKNILNSMDQAVQAENLSDVEAIIKKMINSPSFLFNSNDIKTQRDRAIALEHQLQRKGRAFQEIIARLEKIQEEGFEKHPKIAEKLLKKASDNAINKEDQFRLNMVKDAYQDSLDVIRVENDRRLAQLMDLLETQLIPIGTFSAPDYMEAEKRLPNLKEIIAKGQQIDPITTDCRKRFDKINQKVETLASLVKNRNQQVLAIYHADSLDAYLKAMKTHTVAFPKDSLTSFFTPIIEMQPLYQYLVSDPMTQNPDNPFWYSVAEEIRMFSHSADIYREKIRNDLEKLSQTQRFVDLWECRYKGPNDATAKIYYFEGKPKKVMHGTLYYTGNAYLPGYYDSQPNFKSCKLIEVHVKEIKKMDHCKFVENMITDIHYHIDIESIIYQIRQLRENKQISFSIFKLNLMNFLFKKLALLTGVEHNFGLEAIVRQLESFHGETHWLCVESSKYSRENQKAESILDRIFNNRYLDTFEAAYRIKQLSLKRGIQWVGFVDVSDPQKLHFRAHTAANEVWVVRKSDHPCLYLSEEQIAGKSISYGEHGGYLPGEPLFSPFDATTSRMLSADIFKELNLSGNDDIQWPSCWPVNLHHL